MNNANGNPIERLEARRLLASAGITGNELVVIGNVSTFNTIFLRFSADKSHIIVRYDSKTKVFATSSVDSVRLVGGSAGNLLQFGNRRNVFDLRATLVGGGGADTMIGGDGPDLFIASRGHTEMIGGIDDDTFVAGGGNDTIIGGTGTDIIFGSTGNDSIVGGGNSDAIYAGSGNDTIVGSAAGTNQIVCSGGNNHITAHDGDTIYLGTGKDTIRGSVGKDGELHSGNYRDLNRILSIITPEAYRFKSANGRQADKAPLT